jgi:hypothetical protein
VSARCATPAPAPRVLNRAGTRCRRHANRAEQLALSLLPATPMRSSRPPRLPEREREVHEYDAVVARLPRLTPAAAGLGGSPKQGVLSSLSTANGRVAWQRESEPARTHLLAMRGSIRSSPDADCCFARGSDTRVGGGLRLGFPCKGAVRARRVRLPPGLGGAVLPAPLLLRPRGSGSRAIRIRCGR